jgi:hypothetical protein
MRARRGMHNATLAALGAVPVVLCMTTMHNTTLAPGRATSVALCI